MKFSSVMAGAAMIAGSAMAADLDPIVIKGSKFFYKSNGTEFFMRGVAYQQEVGDDDYRDPLANAKACARDIPLLEELHTNTIRVYAVDPKKDHTKCMKLLADAGIYVIADLGEPKTSIIRSDPKWNDELYERYTAVIDSLADYTNVLGFFAGNEVSNNNTNTDASAFVKAAVRDMKKYIKDEDYRPMGVGYATNDDEQIRDEMTAYFNCGSDEVNIDFWGYNIYSWCGDSSYKESGFDKVVKDFKDFNVPVFFAEYGCNEVQPRKFTEVEAIYGDKMTPVLSGGIVYMYFQEANDYGLVEIEDGKAEKMSGFKNLKKQLEDINPSGVEMDEYKPTNTALSKCPEKGKNWKASTKLPPTPNRKLCECMVKSLSCVADPELKTKQLGKLFGNIYGMDDEKITAGIAADAEEGVYGPYSMCSPKEQLSYAFDAYYQANGQSAKACDFDGSAKTQKATEAEGKCASLIEEAAEQATAGGTSGSGSDGSGDESEASGSTGAAPTVVPAFSYGGLKLGAYLFCAISAGAGMILL